MLSSSSPDQSLLPCLPCGPTATWSLVGKWHLITARNTTATGREDKIKLLLPRRIPYSNADKPTVIFTTPGVCGTGMNGLVAANWALMLDIPFRLHLTHQALGRFRRYRQ